AGLALMLGVARLINFAHGEFFMLGAYAFWLGYSELGLPYPVAALLAPAVMVLFGIAYQRTVIRAILPRSWHVQLIATLATSIVLTNLAIVVLGTQPKEVPTALAALAAALVSPLFNIFPDMGTVLTLKAFAAVVAGGFGYVNGAIAASFLIGLTEALAGSYVSYAYKDAIAFLMMIAVLLWRPQGLFGRRIGI